MNRTILPALLVAAVAALPPWAAAADGPWKSLFDGKNLGDWKISDRFEFIHHGPVEVADGAILIGTGRPGSAIRYAGNFPKSNYELALDAMRADGEDFFCGLTFPAGDAPCSLIVGGWGGPVVGLSCIDGEPAVENETSFHKEFALKQWYAIRLRVTAEKIEAWIDDEKVVDFEIGDHRLTIWFEEETVLPLSVATWRTAAAVRNVRVRELEKGR